MSEEPNERPQNEREIAQANIQLLKQKVAGLLTQQGMPIRDAIFQRLNQRLGKLQPNPQKQEQPPPSQQRPQETIRCPNCGRELPKGIRFCYQCGKAIQEQAREDKKI